MSKHYMTADEIYNAWQYRKNGASVSEIVKSVHSSTGQVWRLLNELDHRLNGGRSSRTKNRRAFEIALTRIRSNGVQKLPTAADFTPVKAVQPELLETKPLIEREVNVLLTTPKMHQNVMLGYLQRAKQALAKRIVFTDNDGKTLLTIEL